ncbi:hypothetical protein D3C73_1556210 [compost metagenome]
MPGRFVSSLPLTLAHQSPISRPHSRNGPKSLLRPWFTMTASTVNCSVSPDSTWLIVTWSMVSPFELCSWLTAYDTRISTDEAFIRTIFFS